MKRNFSGQEKHKNWILLKQLDAGGNGDVWICKNEKDDKRAIKLLKKNTDKAFQRFKDEIKIISENQDIEGIVKIEEHYLPEDYINQVPFYIMPLGEPFDEKIENKNFQERIDIIFKIADCLYQLHQRKIAHRDIKTSNLIFLNDEPYLIDFGLVDFPEKADITGNKEKIGPRWTMAPEIIRRVGQEEIDFFKCDIYSLAKTLWMTLTNSSIGFEGQYNIDTILELKRLYPDEYTTPIDNLLKDATDNDPKRRPDAYDFLQQLNRWKQLNGNFHLRNNNQWIEILNKLFPVSIPQRVVWIEIEKIIQVLQILGSTKDLNHLFLPESGGLDLIDARKSVEDNCIELDLQSIYIIKPQRLIFESFGEDLSWSYFRLETGDLQPSGVYESDSFKIQELVSELNPGQYDKFEIAERRSYYRDIGYNIPENTRHVTRYFNGNFVIFNKRSHYNLDLSTYDGRHNKMETTEFRNYIQQNINEQQNGSQHSAKRQWPYNFPKIKIKQY